MEFKKMVTITLYARQKKRHRYIEQTFGLYDHFKSFGKKRFTSREID